jgi:xanthine dehydrogenase accessory factor
MSDIETIACTLLDENQPFFRATIISRHGSVPRTAGANMLITMDGRIHGTIGGGLLEARTIDAARKNLFGEPARFIPFDLNHEAAATMDMICGGNAEVLLDRITPGSETADLFQRWRQALEQGRKSYLTTVAVGPSTQVERVVRCLIYADGSVVGELPPEALTAAQVLDACASSAGIQVITLDRMTMIIEPSVTPKTVYIFGAGHVAQPTAQMASLVGFRVAVLDDRGAFANAERFPDADEIRVIADFDRAFADLRLDGNAFVVILTRGHTHDKTVLMQALGTNAGYIGMIGSRRKRDLIFRSLLEQGFAQQDLDRVHAPIGLSIGAETPEEIAVSIVAELIQERAARS